MQYWKEKDEYRMEEEKWKKNEQTGKCGQPKRDVPPTL